MCALGLGKHRADQDHGGGELIIKLVIFFFKVEMFLLLSLHIVSNTPTYISSILVEHGTLQEYTKRPT